MLVYRFEDASGNGLYNGCYAYKVKVNGKSLSQLNGCDGHQRRGPIFDFPDWKSWTSTEMAQYQFGFRSKTQLLAWVPRAYYNKLVKKGCFVVTLRVPFERVKFGNTQVAFMSKYATDKRRVSI